MKVQRQLSQTVRIVLLAAIGAGVAGTVAARDLSAAVESQSEARHIDPTIRRAIGLLPSGVTAPVEVVDVGRFPRPLHELLKRSCTFVVVGVERIYVNGSCPVYLRAERSMLDVLKLAALFRHEEAHLRGADEADARSIEAATFRTLLQTATAEYQTPGMLYAASLDRLARSLMADYRKAPSTLDLRRGTSEDHRPARR